MPYFTHLRKKSSFAVVETNGILYVDGQGYNPDTLKLISGAEFDVFSPTPNSASFFDFGTPAICLPRSSYICKTSQLSAINSGKVKVFDSSLFLTGQSVGNLGVSSGGNILLSTKNDPSGADQKNDKLVMLKPDMEYLQAKYPISIQTGTENKAYRLNTMFWNRVTGSTKVFAINSETLVRGNTTSNNVASFDQSDLSTYQAIQSDKTEVNQLVYLDVEKANSVSDYAVLNRSQISSSSTRSPQTWMVNTSTGATHTPIVEKIDLGLSSYWISLYGALGVTGGSNQGRSIAVASDGSVYGVSSSAVYKLDARGSLVWHQQLAYSGTSVGSNDAGISIDSAGQIIIGGQAGLTGSCQLATAALDSSGQVLWQRAYGSTDYLASATDTCIDADNNSYSCGYTQSTVTSARSSRIVKRNSSGGAVWGTGLYDNSIGCAVDSNRNVYIVGNYKYNTSLDYYKMYLYRISSAGQKEFTAFAESGTGLNSWTRVAIDSSNNIYVVGAFGTSYTPIVAKYNTSGTLIWSKQLSSSANSISGPRVAVDKSGYVYVLFMFNTNNTKLLKIDGSGNVIWCNSISFGNSVSLSGDVAADAFGNVYVQVSGSFVSGDVAVSCVMKVPPDGTGTGTYTFSRGNLVYASSTASGWANQALTTSLSTQAGSLVAGTDSGGSLSLSSPSYPSTRQYLTSSYDPAPDSHVGCFASNAVWTTFNEGAGPVYFTGNCPFSGSLGIDFVRVRYITDASPTAKRVYATISNPSNMSLAIPSDVDYRNVRPFLFKTDSNALMLGVFAYYNGSASGSNVAALMLFSVGSTTLADSITLTYLQRIDLSESGTGFITGVTPVDNTQRVWVVNYGDKAKVYTWSQASNFTLKNTYNWGRSGQIDSYGIDSRGRLWYTTGDVLSYIPLKTDLATVDPSVKAFFDSSAYTYTGSPISSNLYVSTYALDGGREQRSVTVTVDGVVVKFADGTASKTVTTTASGDLALPVTVSGIGILQAKIS